jgi:hypothetical protein
LHEAGDGAVEPRNHRGLNPQLVAHARVVGHDPLVLAGEKGEIDFGHPNSPLLLAGTVRLI